MKFSFLSKPLEPARKALLETRIDEPSRNQMGARHGRLICAMTLTCVALIFLLSGVSVLMLDSFRDQNDPLQWPECEPLQHDQTFMECRDQMLGRFRGCAIAGGAMLVLGCIMLIMDSVIHYAESLHVNQQRDRRITAVTESQNNYGSGL